jgi:hypothetical protein
LPPFVFTTQMIIRWLSMLLIFGQTTGIPYRTPV